ncbi:hypothetical protein ACM01_45135 [Streptomyces viridochromogenes]|uniref:DUF4232 domain-containing protein n=1 Tax=Streptomyces viridochromogenes TaxID=1938 RepID=A0A0J8BME2_STRVR|nr:DUF4232 domain-containing protein [Streptomyces viridochromogenes]KMS66755.1 hypothetical protein ACM01_45135 [Streptomyces viridochromogenes]KOG10517.1 hypothetical protein ADK35_37905 [Streptomyces viridochromogenes]KOG18621.1 hypothetical protein ADK36_21735 [Streptomyces viridochromogenes]
MRATSLTVAALAAALLLTACDDGDKGQDSKTGSSCADEVSVKFGPANAAPAAGDTGNVPVTVTNRGGAECTLEGLPAIEFDSGDTVTTVRADEAGVRKTTFAKDASTSFILTYVRGEGGGTKSLPVKQVKIHLPGATKTRDFKWSYGDVALKSDGQTPDASVSGFQQSGD